MSEKRFSVGIRRKDNEVFYSFFDGDNPLNLDNIVDLLNEQQTTISALKEENKQLKQSNDRFADTVAKQVSLLIELRKENEQLRHELDSLTGCYCADNKEFKDYWRIGYDD